MNYEAKKKLNYIISFGLDDFVGWDFVFGVWIWGYSKVSLFLTS